MTERFFKAVEEYKILERTQEQLRKQAQKSINVDGWSITFHAHYDQPRFSIRKSTDWSVGANPKKYMEAFLSNSNQLVFLEYGAYTKVDAYLIQQEMA